MRITLRELLERGDKLRAQAREHKSAIYYHRKQLRRVATELARLEADSRAAGETVEHQPTGVGAIHGQ